MLTIINLFAEILISVNFLVYWYNRISERGPKMKKSVYDWSIIASYTYEITWLNVEGVRLTQTGIVLLGKIKVAIKGVFPSNLPPFC